MDDVELDAMKRATDRMVRQTAVLERVNNVCSVVIPALFIFCAVLAYTEHHNGRALWFLTLATFNVSMTIYLQRLHERRTRAFEAHMAELEAERARLHERIERELEDLEDSEE